MSFAFKHWNEVPADFWRWPHFKPLEIACKGDASLLVDTDALDKLEALRTMIGKTMFVRSGYRNHAHNRFVGGAINSMHLEGRAFDIDMWNHSPKEFEAAAIEVGFKGIGHYPGPSHNFMHIDTGRKRRWSSSAGFFFPTVT